MKKREQRKPTFAEALLPLIAMLIILTVGYGILGFPKEAMLVMSAAFTAMVAFHLGVTWDDMIEGVSEKIAKAMPTILILLAVGIIVSSWMLSGTIPMMIYYGIQIVNPKFFYVTSFIICAVISTCTGTSWGSMGTIGVVLVIIAQGLGLSLPITAGAVVGGSYFGDKMSPLSDTTNLAPLAAGSTLYEHIQHMFYTTVPAAIGAIILYTVLGLNTSAAGLANSEKVDMMMANLSSIYHWNILLLVPIIIILYGSITKKPTIPVMLISSAVACLIGVFYQGFTFTDVFASSVSGFSMEMVKGTDTSLILPEIEKLLCRGGMNSMQETILLILCAFSFAGIIARAGCLDVILEHLMHVVKTRFTLIAATVVSTITMALATGSDFLTILIPGELYAPVYKKMGLAARNLSRTLEDSGTCVVALIPWSAAGAYASGALGIATIDYLPYAFFCFFSVIMALVCAGTGFGIMTLEQEEQKKKGAN